MGEYGADDFYFEEDEQNIWGQEFHFLPFVSIFGASTAGAVNAIMVMSRDGVPLAYAILFLACWAVGTGVLLVADFRFLVRRKRGVLYLPVWQCKAKPVQSPRGYLYNIRRKCLPR